MKLPHAAALALVPLSLPGLAPRLWAQEVTLETVVSGVEFPVHLCSPPGDLERLFFVERAGRVRIIDEGVLLPDPFLDVSSEVGSEYEGGLLGLAFHPDYTANGRFFVYYTDLGYDIHVVEHAVSANPDVADPSPVQTILMEANPGIGGHVAGCLQFGPDGMLYVSIGDTGTDAYAQDTGSAFGKVLRLDVDAAPPFVPPDNPFVGSPGVDERIWALGLRNPWRFSFDALTGDLWIGDVGWLSWEEINFQPAASTGGENYGWPCYEGEECSGSAHCDCADQSLVPPVQTYDHQAIEGLSSVTGGYVYRGAAIPDLQGAYVHGDYKKGTVWSLRLDDQGEVTDFHVLLDELAPLGSDKIEYMPALGVDAAGELYVLDFGPINQPGMSQIFKIVPCGTESFCESAPSSVGPGAVMGSEGSLSIAADELELTVEGAVPGQFGLFFYGGSGAQLPFGDGFLCVVSGGQGIWRLNPAGQVDPSGALSRPLDFDAPPAGSGDGQILPASTWYFQFWYRDPAAGGAGFNLSNGLSARFCP